MRKSLVRMLSFLNKFLFEKYSKIKISNINLLFLLTLIHPFPSTQSLPILLFSLSNQNSPPSLPFACLKMEILFEIETLNTICWVFSTLLNSTSWIWMMLIFFKVNDQDLILFHPDHTLSFPDQSFSFPSTLISSLPLSPFLIEWYNIW